MFRYFRNARSFQYFHYSQKFSRFAILRARIRRFFPPPGSPAGRALAFATWIPVIVFFNRHVAELTFIEGGSMYPFMNEDHHSTLRRDLVLNWKWDAEYYVERGMVVTFRSPYHPEIIAVKRVSALEGDVIRTKKPYPFETVTVPPGHIWVEGDGPPGSSLDSNTYGPISKGLLIGKVSHIVLPLRKFGQIKWWEYQPRPLESMAPQEERRWPLY